MIELYTTIIAKLAEIQEFSLIDIEGTNEAKIFPSAYVYIQPIKYEQASDDYAVAPINFNVKIEVKPNHRSGFNSPVLNELKQCLKIVNDTKNKLLNEAIDYIDGIMITGEGLTKKQGKYTALLQFIGRVEYLPD